MQLSNHVDYIRQLIDKAFRNRLGRMGMDESRLMPIDAIANEYHTDRARIESVLEVFQLETGSMEGAFEKLVEELTFTLFNRLAALKVMESHTLHPEVVTRREIHGGRSFAHLVWLEQNPSGREQEADGLLQFLEDQFNQLSIDIPLFSKEHPYHLLPTAIELQAIINAFNQVEADTQIETDIWKSDDILGWLYESYNNYKKAAHKADGGKTEYNKVSIQSQVYTPRWVVQFLVDNSLGKLYLEMYPDSEIRHTYKIANAPTSQSREKKPLTEIRMIDPSTGSGNFLLYGFDLFYDLYLDQIDHYGADYHEADIPKLIIENNLYGIDLDDRAVQLAQLGLYIKAKRKKRSIKIDHFNIVSTDFFLPEYDQVKSIFEDKAVLDSKQKEIIRGIWSDLQQAYKFGSLIRLEEKLSIQLHGIQQDGVNLFSTQEVESFENFREQFFTRLQEAIDQNTDMQGITFLNAKTRDAITFLQVISQKYDVAVANPPYTDSADFGPELKKFVEANYRQPYKFNINLYAVFIKRCYELTDEKGKLALIHPLTFMYIKTYEDVRRFILDNIHISVFVDYGLSNLFGAIMVDPAFYVLEKEKSEEKESLFISLDQYTRTPNEKFKKDFCIEAINDFVSNRPNKHNITLPQEKLKIIEGWPFIYWISDAFREKFRETALEVYAKNAQGMSVSNGEKYQRFHWEVAPESISNNHILDGKRWVRFTKGGPFNRWHGNNWLLVDWLNNGSQLKNDPKAVLRNQGYYFLEGITYSSSGSKGSSFRHLPENYLFSGGGPSITLKIKDSLLFYLLGFLNSKVCMYILECLNPTVNTTQGDLNRIPFVLPSGNNRIIVSDISLINTQIKKRLCTYSIIETNFVHSPLTCFEGATLKDRLLEYLYFENAQLTHVLINEAIINELIFEVYELSLADREQVEAKMGQSIGAMPVLKEAKEAFIQQLENPQPIVIEHIQNLPVSTFDEQQVGKIVEGLATLYQSNNNLEEFCISNKVNPINVWYWFREAGILPKGRAANVALEFLADTIRTLLQNDDDGIIPLVGLPGEYALSQRLEQHCLQEGFTSAQYMQLESLLGYPVNEYLEHHFFKLLSDHLNLFMYLPKTPFIWHISSGQYQGFEVYILIYKWNRDSLFKLKTKYIRDRVENLEYRQIKLQDANSALAQSEKEKIRYQQEEIRQFLAKIDELIAEGYDPKLDDGVGKNIAPLQKKGMLRADVLKAGDKNSQLEKYLNADW